MVSPAPIDPASTLGRIIIASARTLRDDTNNARAITDLLGVPAACGTPDLTWRWVSQEVARTLGRPPAEIAGHSLFDILGDEALELLRPRIERALAGEFVEDDQRFLGGDHVWRWVHVIYAPTLDAAGRPDGWVMMPYDPIEQQRAAQRLMDNELRFRELVDSLPAIAWLTDEQRATTFVNQAFEKFTGVAAEELVQDWLSFFHPDDRASYMAASQAALADQREWRAELRIRRHDGVYRWFEVVAAPRKNRDRFLGYTGITFDITERKTAEEALREANRQKDEFIAVLSHELRNPMAAISNAVAILDRFAADAEPARRAGAIIQRQLAHLSRITDDLLDTGRLIAGRINLARVPVDLAEVVRRSFETFELGGRIAAHPVQLTTAPAWVNADPDRLAQIVDNLLDNALKFSPDDAPITLAVAAADGRAILTVTDRGIGIAAEFLPQLFQPFAQAKPAFSGRPSGLGLGLALVKQLVEMHGGAVSVAADGPDRGATFVVTLPLIDPPLPTPAAAPAVDPAAPRPILLVEDNDDAREITRTLLELQGFRVADAADGPAALDFARRFQPRIALIDLALPTWDGFEVARRLRAEFGAAIHLIALTGFGREKDRTDARAAGFDDFLVKPIDPDALIAKLRRIG